MPTISEALATAQQLHRSGRLREAEAIYRQILQVDPGHAVATHLLGLVAVTCGSVEPGIALYRRSIALNPGSAAVHGDLGAALKGQGKVDEAIAAYRQALALDPHGVQALHNLSDVLCERGDLDEAQRLAERAAELRPDISDIQNNLGNVFQKRGATEQAIEYYRRALQLKPDNALAWNNLANAWVILGNYQEAVKGYHRAIEFKPDYADAWRNLGETSRAQGNLVDALACFRKSLEIQDAVPETHLKVGHILYEQNRFDEAIHHFQRVLTLCPAHTLARNNLGLLLKAQGKREEAASHFRRALELESEDRARKSQLLYNLGLTLHELGRLEEAVYCFNQGIEADPGSTHARIGLASFLSEIGEFERAEQEYQEILRIDPSCVSVYYNKATYHKANVSDHELERMNRLLHDSRLSHDDMALLSFALGSVHDRRKDYRTAGFHFEAANRFEETARLQRHQPYETVKHKQSIDMIIETFSKRFLEQHKESGHESRRPIFVVGLPRSGTTLIEQILASHPAVHGAGELDLVDRTLLELPMRLGIPSVSPFEVLAKAGPSVFQTSANAYLQGIEKLNVGARHVVDKLPDNINMLGWIRLMFPRAHIIHCKRDLRDVALSCWQTSFGAIRWSNTWDNLANKFTNYLRIVEHWKTMEGLDLLEYQYESLVEQPESLTRRLLDDLRLEWHPNCMKFHETKRQVRTASLSQVREPIYKSSVAKWKNYEGELAPLVEALTRAGHVFEKL